MHTHRDCYFVFIKLTNSTIMVPTQLHTSISKYICTLQTCIHTYIHTYIHAYIHTYMLTYVLIYSFIVTFTNIPTYIHTYIHTHKHTNMHTYMHTYRHTGHLYSGFKGHSVLHHLQLSPLYMPSLQTGLTTTPRSMLASLPVDWGVWIGSCVLLPA